MAITRKKPGNRALPTARLEHDDTESVTAFLDDLDHPMKPVLQKIRAAILSADKAITEGIKWNTASFYRQGWFATINVRARAGVQIILHQGAKIRAGGSLREKINDTSHLLAWLGKDRAAITFANAGDFESKRAAFIKVIKQWAAQQADL
jgi:hypothetical protein